jgi:hypothetical protein
MVNYGDLQFAERIMVARQSEMAAEWKIRFADRRATMILSANSGMIKADRKGKASGLENLRPYHRMESLRKSNILS